MRLNPGIALLFLRTCSYLKREQLLYRAKYALRRRAPVLRSKRASIREESLTWQPLNTMAPFLANSAFNVSDIADGRFRFLNDTADFGHNPDWTGGGRDRLWRYNLHYFDYLMAHERLPDHTGGHLIEHWISNNPPGARDAWDPYPTSLRLVNWIKYLSTAQSVPAWAGRAVKSIRAQTEWLEDCLEYHLLGNHLFKNAKALIFAGLFYHGERAERCLAKGLNILGIELQEQILPDGGHFERSLMYHSMIFEDCLDLLNVLIPAGQTVEVAGQAEENLGKLADLLRETISRMALFLSGTLHPDEQIPLFNDAAIGIEKEPSLLLAYYTEITGKRAADPGYNMWDFPESGYFIMAPLAGNRLIVDCGLMGPDYQSGHGHCDLLSFELSLGGRRVIVDSGCSQYEQAEIRKYNRGNLGHNTVTIDGCNQSEVWASHRCARRARPIYAWMEGHCGAMTWEGAHDGYKRLPGSPVHHRSICWAGDEIKVRDCIRGKGKHAIESRLHVNPELVVESQRGVVLIRDGEKVLAEVTSCGTSVIELIEGWYCPSFGVRRPCTVLRIYAD